MSEGLAGAIDWVYEQAHDPTFSEDVQAWSERHCIRSLGILTIAEPRPAAEVAEWLAPTIEGRTVVEIGAGVGLLACEMASYAKHVYAIEANPAWSWLFTKYLFRAKPPNLTWIFGRAEDVAGWLRCDVAVIVTRSGHDAMQAVAGRIAVSVIDVVQDAAGALGPDRVDEPPAALANRAES